jgi:hypothetical protein
MYVPFVLRLSSGPLCNAVTNITTLIYGDDFEQVIRFLSEKRCSRAQTCRRYLINNNNNNNNNILNSACAFSWYRCAPVSTGNTTQDLPRLCEKADNTGSYICVTSINTVKFN